MRELKDNILKEAKRIEEDALYSSKGHFAACARLRLTHYSLGIPTVVLSALAGASVLAKFDCNNIVAGIASIIVAILSALITFLNPNDRASQHLDAGNRYNAIRNRARILYEIDSLATLSEEDLVKELKALSDERDNLNLASPQIPKSAFGKARKGIESGEASYVVDHR